MQVENISLSGYASIIAEATGAPDQILAILEEIMRTEIYHSTLDWQSATELSRGARKAYARYQSRREYYDAQARWKKATWRLFVAEETVEALRERSDDAGQLAAALADLEKARFEEAAARVTLDES